MMMKRSIPAPLGLLGLLLAVTPMHAADAPGLKIPNLNPDAKELPESGAEVVDVSIAWSASGYRAGEVAHFALVLEMDATWHVYTNRASELQSTKVRVEQAPAFAGPISFTFPPAHKNDPTTGEPVYEHRVVIYGTLSPAADAPVGEHPIGIAVSWFACQDNGVCLNEVTVPITATLKIVAPAATIEPTNAEMFAELTKAQELARLVEFDVFGWKRTIDPDSQFILLLGAAMLGGFLLNLTPCVLPLIPIKVMGLSRAAGNRSRCLLLGGFVFAGVVAFWMTLALMIVSITGFQATNQLFQNSAFTIGVGVVIAVMAVAMMGLFTVRLPQAVYAINPSQDTLHGSFLFGVMTAVLSTPCTAPFMGTAAAWAATRPAATTLSVFAAIGVGMAIPYLVLAAFPALTHRMPKAGPASELIKQVMGLLMLAAAAYFLGTGLAGALITPPDPPTLLYWWVIAAAIVAAGVWLGIRTLRITPSAAKRTVFVGIGAVLVFAGVSMGVRFTDRGPVKWVYYVPQRLAEAQQQDKIVVLDFTAQWCANCQFLEQTVLYTDDVAAALNAPDVAAVKVDITTKRNQVGNDLLIKYGRRSIPLLVVLDRTGKEVFKGDWYSADQVLDAIGKARGDTADTTAAATSAPR